MVNDNLARLNFPQKTQNTNSFAMYSEYFLYPSPLPFNTEITLRSHVPPTLDEVYERRYEFGPEAKYRTGRLVNGELPAIEYLLPWPPLPGKDGEEEISIRLLDNVAPPVFDRQHLCRAVVLSDHLPGATESTAGLKVVAEVFDPLLFEYIYRPSAEADTSYVITSMCYNLLKDLQGKTIPKFYGSYTMKMPVKGYPAHPDREVRVVLREYIEGTGLDDLDPKSLSQEERKKMMEKVIRLFHEMDNKGVSKTQYFQPDGFILADRSKLRLVYWDFGQAVFSPTIKRPISWEKHFLPGLYATPFLTWRKIELERYEFDFFVDWPWARWLHETFGSEYSTSMEKRANRPQLDPIEPEGTTEYLTSQSTNRVVFSYFDIINQRKERAKKRAADKLLEKQASKKSKKSKDQ